MHEFTDFSELLIFWYKNNKRDLPWRNTSDPYLIWVSEIILQQTRVAQGLSYYLKITALYPTVSDMAGAYNEVVMRNWQGLGYYSRARNMHATAQNVVKTFNGKFPTTYNELIKLKGIGRYTAAAIASMAGNEVVPVVDGNVYRLISRYFGIFSDVSSAKAYDEFADIAMKYISKKDPGTFNQAMMELGATVCTPLNTRCLECPISYSCYAYNKGVVGSLPVKAKKIKARDRFFNYLVFKEGNNVLMKKRNGKDIWASLYDFPLIETQSFVSFDEIQKHDLFVNFKFTDGIMPIVSDTYKHQLTHQTIYAVFYQINFKNLPEIDGTIQVNVAEVFDQPIPRLVDKYLQNTFADKE